MKTLATMPDMKTLSDDALDCIQINPWGEFSRAVFVMNRFISNFDIDKSVKSRLSIYCDNPDAIAISSCMSSEAVRATVDACPFCGKTHDYVMPTPARFEITATWPTRWKVAT